MKRQLLVNRIILLLSIFCELFFDADTPASLTDLSDSGVVCLALFDARILSNNPSSVRIKQVGMAYNTNTDVSDYLYM